MNRMSHAAATSSFTLPLFLGILIKKLSNKYVRGPPSSTYVNWDHKENKQFLQNSPESNSAMDLNWGTPGLTEPTIFTW